MATAKEIAEAVWHRITTNAWQDNPTASEILVAIEFRVAAGFVDVLQELATLRTAVAELTAAHTTPPE